MAADAVELTVVDVDAWRGWLAQHVNDQPGVWLLLSRKSATSPPTTLTYAQALEEALCQGWIDGQARRLDAATYHQRFTPRRQRSLWSRRNVGIVAALDAAGRLQPAGRAEVLRAQSDGRWDAAYAGPASIEVPADLAAALAGRPGLPEVFASLSAKNRYAVLHRVTTAVRPETRAARITKYTDMLADGQTPHPQPPRPSP